MDSRHSLYLLLPLFFFSLELVNGSLFIYLLIYLQTMQNGFIQQSETNTLIMVAISPKLPLGKWTTLFGFFTNKEREREEGTDEYFSIHLNHSAIFLGRNFPANEPITGW